MINNNRLIIKIILSLIVTICVVDICPSMAYFKAKEKTVASNKDPLQASSEPTPSVDIPGGESFVFQIGQGEVGKSASKGNELPLDVALGILLPTNEWEINDSGDSSEILKQIVSWESSGSWLESLRVIGKNHNIRFILNWNTKTLFVKQARRFPIKEDDLLVKESQVEPVATDTEVKTSTPLVEPVATDTEVKISTPLVAVEKEEQPQILAPIEVQLWSIVPGSLKKQLTEWCLVDGYKLQWNSKSDWMISTNAEFRGSFIESIKTLFHELDNQKTGIFAELYTDNKVLVIKGE